MSLLTELEKAWCRFSTKMPPRTGLGGSTNGSWSTNDYYHADGNGNITYLVNSSQTLAASYSYDAYGNLLASSGTLASSNTYRFSSKEYIPTAGLYYYLYRFYDPLMQRWINRDPAWEPGTVMFQLILQLESETRKYIPVAMLMENVKSSGHTILMNNSETLELSVLSSYEFVSNNPNSLVDSLGLYIFPWTPIPAPPGSTCSQRFSLCVAGCKADFASTVAGLRATFAPRPGESAAMVAFDATMIVIGTAEASGVEADCVAKCAIRSPF